MMSETRLLQVQRRGMIVAGERMAPVAVRHTFDTGNV